MMRSITLKGKFITSYVFKTLVCIKHGHRAVVDKKKASLSVYREEDKSTPPPALSILDIMKDPRREREREEETDL